MPIPSFFALPTRSATEKPIFKAFLRKREKIARVIPRNVCFESVNIHSLLLRAPRELDAIIVEIVLEKSEFEKSIDSRDRIGTRGHVPRRHRADRFPQAYRD